MFDRPNSWLSPTEFVSVYPAAPASDERWFVNSATGLSRDVVYSAFPEADGHGSIPLDLIERELAAGAIVGNVTIRNAVRSLYGQKTGQEITDERARQLLKRGFVCDTWRDLVKVSYQNSITTFVDQAVQSRTDGIAVRTGETRAQDLSMEQGPGPRGSD